MLWLRWGIDQGLWAKLAWLWDFPPVKSLRMAFTAAQWSMHLPTLLALAATQWSVIFAHVGSLLLLKNAELLNLRMRPFCELLAAGNAYCHWIRTRVGFDF